jgi:hypothetical protein
MVSQKIAELAIAPQSAMGAAATAAMFRTRFTGGDLMPVRNVPDFPETGRNRLPRTSFVASFGAEGNPAMGVRDDIFGLLLWGALGTLVETGAADPWTKTITPANTLPYFTFWRMSGDLVWEKFVDCKIGQLEFTSEAEAAITSTATVVGIKAQALDATDNGTEVDAAPEAGEGEPGTGLYVHHMGSGLLLAEGVAVSRMERVAITIANGSARQYGDSIYADDISEGAQDITIATRQRVIDAALYNRLHYGTDAPASPADPTGTILELGAGGLDLMWRRVAAVPGPERSIRFQTGSRVQVTAVGGRSPGTGNDPLREEPTYRVMDPDSGVAFTGIINNGIEAYAA